MPRYVIDSSGWDGFLASLQRNKAPEKVLAVFRLAEGKRFEVLTAPGTQEAEQR